MGKLFGIVNLLAILFFAGLISAYLTYINNDRQDFEKLRLADQVKLATNAATAATLMTSGRLNIDYANKGYLNIDPNQALDNFVTVFCYGYNMMPDTENKDLVMQHIPVAAVATFNGYYIARQRLVQNGNNYPDGGGQHDVDYKLQFGMKMPYTYSYQGDDYALNMGLSYAYELSGGSLSKYIGMPPSATGSLSNSDAWHIINSEISDDMSYAITQENQTTGSYDSQFYIPDKLTTISGTNPIEGPSFIVVVEGIDFTTPKPISGFGLAGSSINESRMVAGYIRNGIKYYTYVDKMPTGVSIQNLYTDPQAAAKAGYYPDIQYLQ